jgi:hypothetical protein
VRHLLALDAAETALHASLTILQAVQTLVLFALALQQLRGPLHEDPVAVGAHPPVISALRAIFQAWIRKYRSIYTLKGTPTPPTPQPLPRGS